MARYFYSEMANRPLIGGGLKIEFKPVGIFGGHLCGVYSTEKPEELALLDACIRKRLGLLEVPKEEYDTILAKKKVTSSAPSPASENRPGPTLAEVVGVVSAERPEVPELSSTKFLEPKDCVSLGAVASPEPFIDEKDRLSPIKIKARRKAA